MHPCNGCAALAALGNGDPNEGMPGWDPGDDEPPAPAIMKIPFSAKRSMVAARRFVSVQRPSSGVATQYEPPGAGSGVVYTDPKATDQTMTYVAIAAAVAITAGGVWYFTRHKRGRRRR